MKTILLGAVLGLLCSGCAALRDNPMPYRRGVASQALSIESEVFDIHDAQKLLSAIVSESVHRIRTSKTPLTSTNTLALIHDSITKCGFRRKTPKEAELIITFGDSLVSRCLDCSDLTSIYLEVGHQFNAPYRVMDMPSHIFLVTDTPQGEVYWETLSGEVWKRERYVNDLRLGPDSLETGAYLSARNENSIIASLCLEIGIRLIDASRFVEAERYLRRARVLHPTSVGVWSCLGYVLGKQGRFAESEEAYREALRLDPKYPYAYVSFGAFLEARSEWEKAEELYGRWVSFAPNNSQARDKYQEVRNLLLLKELGRAR